MCLASSPWAGSSTTGNKEKAFQIFETGAIHFLICSALCFHQSYVTFNSRAAVPFLIAKNSLPEKEDFYKETGTVVNSLSVRVLFFFHPAIKEIH